MNDALLQLEKDTLFLFFGDTLDLESADDRFAAYSSDSHVVSVYRGKDSLLFCVDLIPTFNKDSQSPIHFVVELSRPLSKRKFKRIFQALNFLGANADIAGTFFGSMAGFDDLNADVRREFLTTQYS